MCVRRPVLTCSREWGTGMISRPRRKKWARRRRAPTRGHNNILLSQNWMEREGRPTIGWPISCASANLPSGASWSLTSDLSRTLCFIALAKVSFPFCSFVPHRYPSDLDPSLRSLIQLSLAIPSLAAGTNTDTAAMPGLGFDFVPLAVDMLGAPYERVVATARYHALHLSMRSASTTANMATQNLAKL